MPASSLTVTCSPPSFSADTTASTSGTCTAVDAHGNHNSCSFSYAVVDSLPPTLNMPPSSAVTATTSAGTNVAYTVTASDNCAFGSLTCTLPNGASVPSTGTYLFPVGTTTVSCTATDQAGHSTSGTFTITAHH